MKYYFWVSSDKTLKSNNEAAYWIFLIFQLAYIHWIQWSTTSKFPQSLLIKSSRSSEDTTVKFWFYSPKLNCGLDLEDSNPFFSYDSPSLWWCITIPSLVTKGAAVQKIRSEQTLIDILNIQCDFYLEHSHPIFFKDILGYDALPSKLSLFAKKSIA